jgi:monoamine oxidase
MFYAQPTPPDHEVVVIGAGLTGIHTAHTLAKAGFRFTLLEAGGGRALGVEARTGVAVHGYAGFVLS